MSNIYSEALEEAYASQPDDEIGVDTIELIHPAFRDEYGQPVTVRVVNDIEDHELGLEAGAPVNPGQMVLFKGLQYQLSPPRIEKDSVPQLSLKLPVVDRQITKYLEQAISLTDPIVVYWRPYLLSEPDAPQADPPVVMELAAAEIANGFFTATASMDNVHNWPFPYQKYTRARFPSL